MRHHQNRVFALILCAATLLHVLFLLIPVARQAIMAPKNMHSVQVRLQRPAAPQPPQVPVAEPAPEEIQPEPAPPQTESMLAPATPSLAVQPPSPEPEPEKKNEATRTGRQVLSWQFDYEPDEPLFGHGVTPSETRPDFYLRDRAGLEDVLNAPSLQLPFADTRIYLVDSYSPGVGGSVERFFDSVTVPFGWTTKNNTRVQCGWVLVFAGCSWGHVSLFHREARKREPD